MAYQSADAGRRGIWLRVYLALAIVLSLAACSPGPGSTTPRSGQSLPPQGLYEGCSLHLQPECLDHLTRMAQAGFKLVLNYDQLYGSASEEVTYAEHAHALGMKIIWSLGGDSSFWDGTDLRREYPDLAATCGCNDNDGFTRYVISLAKSLPATWGYYIGDEVKVTNHSKLRAFSDLIHQLDPQHPRLLIQNGSDGGQLALFADTTDVIGMDMYPVGDPKGSLSLVATTADTIRSVAERKGKQSAIALQAFNWNQYPRAGWSCTPFPACATFPTEQQMRSMRDAAVAAGQPSILLWYSYFDVFRSDAPERHWHDLVQAAGANGG